MDGVSIDKYFEDYIPRVNIVCLADLFVQLIECFQYIENMGIVHRDIRDSNTLVTNDGTAKIIDFVLGKTFS